MLERKIYIFAKSVDMRKQMNGLIQIAKNEFKGQIFSTSKFVFCNKGKDKIKVLEWDKDGFIVTYKRMEKGIFKYPFSQISEVDEISISDYRRLMQGLYIEKYIISQKYLVM